MMKKILLFVLICLVLGFGCSEPTNRKSETKIDAEVQEILSGMTLEEKVGQMTQITLDVFAVDGEGDLQAEPVMLDMDTLILAFRKYKIGSILNTVNNRARDADWWNNVIDKIQEIALEECGIPMLYGIDAIHGVNYTAGATLFPQQIGQGATFNPDLVRTLNEICAYEMRASGIPWNFSPVQDMGRDPRDARMWETYGEDGYLNGVLGAAAVEGMQGKDAEVIDQYHGAACLKHYLGYVSTSGKDRNPLHLHARDLLEKHVPAFQAAIDAGAKSVMISSGLINGIPVHMSYDILTTLLREEMGFDGLIVTDWLDIENLHKRDKIAATHKEAVKLAINAGIDMSMVPYNFRFCEYLIELVNDGEVPMTRIDDAVARVLKLKMEVGLFDQPTTKLDNYPEFGSEKFEEAAFLTALESITLLKNENNVLPLSSEKKVLVAGPNANSMRPMNGGWSYSWQGEKVHEFAEGYNTFLEAIRNKIGKNNVTYFEGVSYDMDGKYYEEKAIDIEGAVHAARGVDYILLFLGENSYCEKPGDLHDLYISDNQAQLALALTKTNKPVILILNEGRPRIISKFENKMKAVIQTYLPGNFGGDALAEIIYGDVNPSGKLPYTYPMFPNSLITYDYKPAEKQEKLAGMYDYESDVAIQYDFGHGLSYTTFEYSNLEISKEELVQGEKIQVSITVENTGDRPGKEVVMLYTSDLYASISPDNKRLCRFEKIELDPAESKTILFEIAARDLAFYNAQNQLISEEGEFLLRINDLEQKLVLKETIAFGPPSKLKL